ncbi:MAG TPA: oligosaccharide flippase family protein [Bacteroidia bacterium]|nr:oligosaccharide flippase family protein [Bacteroidia bacterium]
MKPLKDLAGQTVVYGLPSIVGRLLNYLLVPLYTYTFSPADYGVQTSLYAYVSFLNIVLTYGMETSLFNFSRMAEDKRKVFSTILTSVSITSVLFLLLAYSFRSSIAQWVEVPEHPEYIIWIAGILAADALAAIAFAKLREMNKARRFAVIKSVNIALNIILNVFFIALCPKIMEHPDSPFYGIILAVYSPSIGIGYIFISNLAASLLTLLILLPEMLKAGIHFDIELWKKIMPYAMPLLVAGFAGMINETLDRILLTKMLPGEIGRQQTGIYGACYKISIILTMFIQAYRYAAEPFFFSNAKDPDFKKNYALITKYFIIVCLLIFMGTALNLSWIQYFVGKNYRSGLKVVPILLLANLCLGVFYNLSIWYKLVHKTIYGSYLTIIGAIITIGLNILWIPTIGYMGSAWATLICYAVCMILCYLWSLKHFPVEFELLRIFGYFALSLTLYFLSTYINFSSKLIELIVNNALILVFIGVVLAIEKPSLAMFKKSTP